MYLTHTNTLLVKALRETFDVAYPDGDFRDIHISQEFPVGRADYPGIWVQFDPTGPLRTVGIGHYEDIDNGAGGLNRVLRWSFGGNAAFTIVALTSLERDRLTDELISVFAFGQLTGVSSRFRTAIETDPLVRVVINWDEIDQSGRSASQGTPWGGDEVVYEGSLQLQMVGEFISSTTTGTMMPISAVTVIAWAEPIESDPTTPGGWID